MLTDIIIAIQCHFSINEVLQLYIPLQTKKGSFFLKKISLIIPEIRLRWISGGGIYGALPRTPT